MMFSDITHVEYDTAKNIIADTETGKLILSNNQAVLYEQQTENLSEIADELKENPEYQQLASMLQTEKIVKAAGKLPGMERENTVSLATPYIMPKNKDLKKIVSSKLRQKQKENVALKKQNLINARRMENVDMFKR